MIRELQAMGFRFELVLADSLSGGSDGNFVNVSRWVELNVRRSTGNPALAGETPALRMF